ncbi:MAG: histidine kinase dimerization/phospho-acceptor domain-containing protein [Novosphingobium sp.]
MYFDDRLATVLRSRASGLATARIIYRQLLDLLGTMPVDAQGPQIDAACDRLGEIGAMISTPERTAMLRDPGMRLRNPRLIAMLANGQASVAAAAIDKAELNEDEWIDLAPALPPGARGFVRQRRDLGPRAEALFDRLGMARTGLPDSNALAADGDADSSVVPLRAKADITAAAKPAKPSGIGAIVQRIEDFRKARGPLEGQAGDVEALFGELHRADSFVLVRAFDFATDCDGCIVWSDPGMAPMAVGLRLTSRETAGKSAARRALFAAVRRRQPIRALPFEIAGAPAIAGRWLIDAAPGFDPQSGSYTGHIGRMRRPQVADAEQLVQAVDSEADRMRQLLHELRTPVNAIQGFAEVIQQQMFGPAPHEYRALAAGIAGDAALILAGFEELDRLARLESGGIELAAGGCDLAAIIVATVDQLRAFTAPRSSGFSINVPDESAIEIALGQPDAERLVWRLLATLAASSAPGEILAVNGAKHRDMVELVVELPAKLASLGSDELTHATAGGGSRNLSAGMFGTGFTLRLAAAEAKAAGGKLERRGNLLEISLPGLTMADTGHSEGAGTRSVT